jgi:hypothetical protein
MDDDERERDLENFIRYLSTELAKKVADDQHPVIVGFRRALAENQKELARLVSKRRQKEAALLEYHRWHLRQFGKWPDEMPPQK